MTQGTVRHSRVPVCFPRPAVTHGPARTAGAACGRRVDLPAPGPRAPHPALPWRGSVTSIPTLVGGGFLAPHRCKRTHVSPPRAPPWGPVLAGGALPLGWVGPGTDEPRGRVGVRGGHHADIWRLSRCCSETVWVTGRPCWATASRPGPVRVRNVPRGVLVCDQGVWGGRGRPHHPHAQTEVLALLPPAGPHPRRPGDRQDKVRTRPQVKSRRMWNQKFNQHN